MDKVNCPKCNSLISKKAYVCPVCKRKIKMTPVGATFFVLFLLALFYGIYRMLLSYGAPPIQ